MARPVQALVVDDVADVRDILQRTLSRLYPDMGVTACASGREAISLVASGGFDLIVSDYRIGDATGYEVLQAARASNPAAILILITAYNDLPADRQGMGVLGIDAVIRKPWTAMSLKILLNRLRESSVSERMQARKGGCEIVEGHLAPGNPQGSSEPQEVWRHCPQGHRNRGWMRYCVVCNQPMIPKTSPAPPEAPRDRKTEELLQKLKENPELVEVLSKLVENLGTKS